MNEIYTRRSIRRYTDQKVEAEKIDKLLRAAMQAPSGMNQQAWEFLVIEDKETLNKLSRISPYASAVASSSATIIVLGNEKEMRVPQDWQQDLGAATQNILLETVTQGLGAVWIGVAPIEDHMNFISDMFDLPNHIHPFSIIPVGYPVEGQSNKFVDRYIPSKVHHEKY